MRVLYVPPYLHQTRNAAPSSDAIGYGVTSALVRGLHDRGCQIDASVDLYWRVCTPSAMGTGPVWPATIPTGDLDLRSWPEASLRTRVTISSTWRRRCAARRL